MYEIYICMYISVCIDIILIHIISGKKTMSSNGIRANIAHGTEENMNFMSLSVQFSSVAQLGLTLCDPMDYRLPCPSPIPGAYSNLCQSSRWCHPTILPSVIPFSSPLQSLPASQIFPRSQFFALGDQSIGASASASALPVNIQDWLPLGLTGLISLKSKGHSRVFSSTTVWKHQFFGTQLLYGPTLISIHNYWKNHSFDYTDICWQNVSAF